jgi:hypothetical protein
MSELCFRGAYAQQDLGAITASQNQRDNVSSGGHVEQGFYYSVRGNWGINPTHHPTSPSYMLERPEQVSAFSATNLRTGTYGDQAGWGVYISGSNWKSTFQGHLGVGNGTNADYPTYELEVVGDVRISDSLGVGMAPNATDGRIDADNDVVAFSSSDIRFKKNTTPIQDALFKIQQLQGIEFDWIPNQEHHGYEGHDVGVIAQEVEKVLPEVVITRDSGYMAVKYEKMIPLLIEGIKEQQTQIDELKKEVKELKNDSTT